MSTVRTNYLETTDLGARVSVADLASLADAGGAEFAWETASFPVYAAHRGLEQSFPENTMIAFEAALNAGVPCIELDVWTLSDGELVVSHDATTNRTVRDLSGNAIALDYRNLNRLDLHGLDASFRNPNTGSFNGGDFQFNRPPLLREVFVAFRGRALFIVDGKGETTQESRDNMQAICDLAEAMQVQPSVLVYGSAGGSIENGLNPKGCKIANRGLGTESQAVLDEYKAAGYYAVLTQKANIDATHRARCTQAGLKLIGSTYIFPDEVAHDPDILFCGDAYTIQENFLAAGRDYLMRDYPGPGYVRGGSSGETVGTAPIMYPVIRTIDGARAIGWHAAHPTDNTGRSRMGVAVIDPDPNNDGAYTLDFDFIWTAIDSDASQVCHITFEMDRPGLMIQNASSSPVKRGYYFGVRANGGAVLVRISGASATATTLVTVSSGLPNPPTVNTRYPCRIVVSGSAVTCTFDPGGAYETILTSADTTHRGGKYMMLERRGHGFMIANLRAS
jgi:hypothetical protein